MSDDKKSDAEETREPEDKQSDDAQESPDQSESQSGPKFTEAPDPLAGVKKSTADVMASMEGKTVSLKVYVGTIIGIILLMLLARCGG